MVKFKNYAAAQRGQVAEDRVRRPRLAADTGGVRSIRSDGLVGASVAFPADIDLRERAARMNAFWRALVDLQHEDVVVVALCATDER